MAILDIEGNFGRMPFSVDFGYNDMALLGTIMNLALAFFAIMVGYTGNYPITYLLFIPIGFMFGYGLQRSSKTSSIFGRDGMGIFPVLVFQYVIGLAVSGVFYGIGAGVMEVLKFRPS